ncbi:hypothetical protein [Amycolatopsis sp. NBC_01480]|uniref:hypothetical protein n=1 Tax=Amycolatopsis sp. NBC_01480 TaxID=2903562 RepID=UPI002E2B5692|nr:hypothetical protein [Amycolatopsis sp. NBC_01480]
MKLPEHATATDVIDALSGEVMELVDEVNAGRELTQAQYAATFSRTFAEALPRFLAGLKAERPELAAQLVEQFMAEQEDRMAAEQPPARVIPWAERFKQALATVYAPEDVRFLADAEGAGALSTVLSKRCSETGEDPAAVLGQITRSDREYALSADAPGAFLASRVRQIPEP